MKKFAGLLIVIFLCFNTINLWIAAKPTLNIIWESPLRSVSQILALLGIVLTSFVLVLSTKFKWLDKTFGGRGNVFEVHHITGSAAFIFLLNHPLLLAVAALPQSKLALTYFFPSSNAAYNFGIFGLYLMILSFICMVFMRLPFKTWRLAHKLLAPAFLLGGIHALLANSDISSFFPLRIWIGFFIVIGVFSGAYSLFWKQKSV